MRHALSVASECAPLVKTGGLADVVGALPAALAGTGWRMRVILPAYPQLSHLADGPAVLEEADLFGGPGRLVRAEAAGLSQLAVNRFSADPGEQLPLAYHYHDEQEEAFFVVAGTMHVETPERTYEVPAGSLFAADPNSPHRAYNAEDADGDLTVLAIGAPQTEGDAHAYDPEAP